MSCFSKFGANGTMTEHNDVIRESFTAQARAFAANPWVADEDRIQRLVAAAQLSGQERVLDIATGPGYIAEAFARVAREVVGVDLTEAMLDIAKERTRSIGNLNFRAADAEKLPFENGTFDVVVCRWTLHHLKKPPAVLREMARVCRVGGTVMVEDTYASEHPERATYQDRWEILRDPSHVHMLALSELLRLFRDAGLETDAVTTADDLTPEVERWLATTKTPPERAAEIRRLLEKDRVQDLSGARPFQDATGRLFFHERTAILVGRKTA
ncbi:MAG TPA: class I SAM-dependent methyltransferase [Candidatus Methylomirabilis sp.]|nr:class I SAM-dependent methyltransferase [Candidatus Methylomirabilis sp.]